MWTYNIVNKVIYNNEPVLGPRSRYNSSFICLFIRKFMAERSLNCEGSMLQSAVTFCIMTCIFFLMKNLATSLRMFCITVVKVEKGMMRRDR